MILIYKFVIHFINIYFDIMKSFSVISCCFIFLFICYKYLTFCVSTFLHKYGSTTHSSSHVRSSVTIHPQSVLQFTCLVLSRGDTYDDLDPRCPLITKTHTEPVPVETRRRVRFEPTDRVISVPSQRTSRGVSVERPEVRTCVTPRLLTRFSRHWTLPCLSTVRGPIRRRWVQIFNCVTGDLFRRRKSMEYGLF